MNTTTTRSPDPDMHVGFMREALALAADAARIGEVPVGCVIVYQGVIIARAKNETMSRNDPTAHAEVLALREAAAKLGNYRLTGCTVYATLEPCVMCAGALIHARVDTLYYSAADPKAGAAGSVVSLLDHPRLNHRIAAHPGLLADDSARLLQDFFRARRSGTNTPS